MSITINSKQYEKIDTIGKGGFGEVLKVKNENRIYALKRIPLDNKEDEEKIKNEANILSRFDSEYIVKYYDSYKDKKYFYILMEYCEGNDLRKLINKYKDEGKLMDEQLIYSIVLDICLGIKEIHKNKIMHRDIKPENIFILNNNKIKIGDFGISKQLEKNKKSVSNHSQIGTFNYAAPELFKGKYNNKVDIWSLGCIIYELLTLNYCFENIYAMFDKVFKNERYGQININKYNNKWQELIDLLLKSDYNKRPNIDEIYTFLKEKFIQIENNKKDNNEKKYDQKNSSYNNFTNKEYNWDSWIYWIISIIGFLLLCFFFPNSSKNKNKIILK